MKTRKEVIDFCLTLGDGYEDYPFSDPNWTMMRHKSNKKTFACIFEREGKIWINVKCDPNMAYFWRNAYEAVIPAYHMNKVHWNSIILDGTVKKSDIMNMIADSFYLTEKHKKISANT